MSDGYYTPDPGTVDREDCDLCGTEMKVRRNVTGPRGFAEAMAGGRGSPHDVFTCPHRTERWHEQAAELKRKARYYPSARIALIMLEEADDIIQKRQTTKDHWL